jgi:hypothetical protein
MEKKQATVNNVFAKNIYQGSVESFEKLNKDIIPHIENFVKKNQDEWQRQRMCGVTRNTQI